MRILKILSQKTNSVVKLVEINGEEFVMKYYLEYCRSALTELRIMSTCQHQNIISAIKIYPSNENETETETETEMKNIGICMEKQDYNLTDILIKGEYCLSEALIMILQIARGLQYLHHHKIAHLDLKSDNIMIKNSNLKIIDFGQSEYLIDDHMCTNQLKCTVTHRPPEGFVDDIVTRQFDIWSFGIIIFEIFSKKPIYLHPAFPHYHGTNYKKYENDMYGFITSDLFKKIVYRMLPDELAQCLCTEPDKRPDIDQIIIFLNKYVDKI